MKDIIDRLIKNKNVLVLGYGREGHSTLRMLRSIGSAEMLAVADARDISTEVPDDVSTFTGEHYLDVIDMFDVVFKTPGIVLPMSPENYKCMITSQTEIFMERFKKQIVGITGTKGKSTTSSLLYHVLTESGKPALFAGNIGIPVFDIAEEVKEDSIIVIELSCHQLEYAVTSPGRAVLLNIYEDHLDHYGTREKYAAAKRNIFLNQGSEDVLYTTSEALEGFKPASRVELITKEDAPVKSFREIPDCRLKGEHNLLNAAFVYKVACEYGVSEAEFKDALSTFRPLPHRLELIGKIDGVDYYDDSISTTVKSTISAVESIENAKILLVGGMERNIDYTELVEYLKTSRLSSIICMYESGKRIFDMYEKTSKNEETAPRAILTTDLSEAVSYAKKLAKEGDACLLSPAAASYGYFKNFEERGDAFKKLVSMELYV